MENKIMTPQNMDIFQTFFEQSADPILILENGLFTDCNHAAEQVLHAHKADFLPISPALISPEFQPDGRLSTEKAAEMINIAIEKGSNRFEWVHRRLNGEDFQVELTLTSVHISGRQLIYTVWRDITKRKKVEDAVKHRNRNFRC
ncbi:MAG: PAS domain S-box protein [Anaerolineales bacterium]|nr:PAS domain S-box protein [Anaerolineales bacterium]